jgi:peptidoglycan/xylan/chitin deacetylase (PgdA/CDA1 family)
MRALGLQPAGFRPPGGGLTPDTPGLLDELGFTYCSPAGGVDTGTLPSLPFRWELLDAYHYLPHFADRRGQEEPLPPERLRDTLLAALEERHGHLILLFHPFLADTDERVQVIRGVLARVRERVDAGSVRCAPCREFV